MIWRQQPKVTGRGHYSHKHRVLARRPVPVPRHRASGSKATPAQDLDTNLGKVLRLNLDGTPAAGNPFAEPRRRRRARSGATATATCSACSSTSTGSCGISSTARAAATRSTWSSRATTTAGRCVSNGERLRRRAPSPTIDPADGFATPAISWNPVIAPGDFIFYSGKLWPRVARPGADRRPWRPTSLVRVSLDGDKGTEEARYPMDKRIRDIVEARRRLALGDRGRRRRAAAAG